MEINPQQSSAKFYVFDIYQASKEAALKESCGKINRNGHSGTVFELASPDGINFSYFNIKSSEPGQIIIKNNHPFIRLTYTISGNKWYEINGGRNILASFKKQEFNYLLMPKDQIWLRWNPEEKLEIFELSVSPEMMLKYLPDHHPFFPVLVRSIKENGAASMSGPNLFIHSKGMEILYDMLNCPLEGRYKQLYFKSKLGELLALELEAFELKVNIPRKHPKLRSIDIERMHQVKDIIISNIQSHLSLIDLAHQVGTNEAYLKRHFKEVFGTTVFGFLYLEKMKQAMELLRMGHSVSEVSVLTGYKYVAHFTRAFKRHFGINPKKVKDNLL